MAAPSCKRSIWLAVYKTWPRPPSFDSTHRATKEAFWLTKSTEPTFSSVGRSERMTCLHAGNSTILVSVNGIGRIEPAGVLLPPELIHRRLCQVADKNLGVEKRRSRVLKAIVSSEGSWKREEMRRAENQSPRSSVALISSVFDCMHLPPG